MIKTFTIVTLFLEGEKKRELKLKEEAKLKKLKQNKEDGIKCDKKIEDEEKSVNNGD